MENGVIPGAWNLTGSDRANMCRSGSGPAVRGQVIAEFSASSREVRP